MQEINKARTRIRALLGIIIIHHTARFVNIHFVRFFVVIFGEKYRVKNFVSFVVVLFVDFAESACRSGKPSNSDLSNCSPRQERSILKVFPSLFSKSDRRSNARSVGRRAHAAKHLIVRKRHRRVNAKPKAWQRGTAQVGGSPFYAKAILKRSPLFF